MPGRFCVNCGSALVEGRPFCTTCGHAASVVSPTTGVGGTVRGAPTGGTPSGTPGSSPATVPAFDPGPAPAGPPPWAAPSEVTLAKPPSPAPGPAPLPAPPVVPVPAPATPQGAGPGGRRGLLYAVVVLVLLLLGAAAAVGVVALRDDGSDPDTAARDDADRDPSEGADGADEASGGEGTDPAPCAGAPRFTARSATEGSSGLTIGTEVAAACPQGQWLDQPGTEIAVTRVDGTALASGVFDFSGDAARFVTGADGTGADGAAVDGTSITLDLLFPASTSPAGADEIDQAIRDGDTAVTCCGAGSTSSPEPEPKTEPEPSPATPLEQLQQIAAEDAATLDGLQGYWIPQLASHQLGVDDLGERWNYQKMLAEHQALRQRYPGALLLDSSDWNYSGYGFWVTVLDQPSTGWRPPLQWCYDEGRTHVTCAGKLLYARDAPYSPVTGTTHGLTSDDQVPTNPPKPPGYDD